jgi:hypothetical protein
MAINVDSYTVIPPNSTGDSIDESALTNLNGVTVKRQRISIGDPDYATQIAVVDQKGALQVTSPDVLELLTQILIELKVLTAMLAKDTSTDPGSTRSGYEMNLNS